MEQNFIEILLTTLKITYTSGTQEIKTAEDLLKQMENPALNSFPSLLLILNDDKVEHQLKLSLMNYLKRIIMDHLKRNAFQVIDIQKMIDEFISFLYSSNNLNDKLIDLIMPILLNCFSSHLLLSDSTICFTICDNITMKFIANPLITLQLYAVLVSSKLCNEETLPYIEERVRKNLILLFSEPRTEIRILKDGINLLQIVIRHEMIMHLMEKYLSDYIIIFSPLIVPLIENNCTNNNMVSFIQKNAPLDEEKRIYMLNSLKAKGLLLLGVFIQYSHKTKIENQLLLELLRKLLDQIYVSLLTIAKEKEKLNHILKMISKIDQSGLGYEPLVYYMMNIICLCIARSPFNLEFQSNAFEFIFTILFQFLCTTQSDLVELNENFIAYHNGVIDSMYGFKIKKIKTIAGYLLSYMCDHFGGLAIKVLTFIFQLLNFNMNEKDDRGIVKYKDLNTPLGMGIIKSFSTEIQIDNCLFFMCILAKHTLADKNIKIKLREFFTINQLRLHKMLSDLIQYKICLIYGLCLDEFFPSLDLEYNDEANTFLYKAIEFLFTLVIDNPNKSFSLVNQALHSLKDLISVPTFREISNQIVRLFIDRLLSLIPTIQIDIFFDCLEMIVQCLDIEDYLLGMIKFVINRLQSDMIASKYSQTKFIIKELNLIQVIIDRTVYTPGIEEAITPLLTYIKNANTIDCSSEITKILLSIAFNQRENTQPVLYDLFSSYAIILKSEGAMSCELFKLLNHLLVHDTNNIINKNEQFATIFSNIIITSLSYVNEYLGDSPSPIYTLLLIQVWLMSNNIITNHNYLKECLKNIILHFHDMITIYQQNPNQITEEYDAYLLWLYLGIIYSSMIHYSNLTLEIIYERNLIDLLITFTDELTNTDFFSCSIAKTIILGMCNMLYQKDSLRIVFTSFGQLFKILFKLLKRQYYEEIIVNKREFDSKLLKAHMVKEIKDNSDDEDDDDYHDSNKHFHQITMKGENYDDVKEDDEKVLKCIKLAVFSIQEDEFVIYKKLLSELNTIPELKQELTDFENGMKEKDKKDFVLICESKRTVIGNSSVQLSVPRKIVKIKR